MKLHTLALPLVLAGGLSSIFFLPDAGDVAQSAIRMDLPDDLNSWQFRKIPPTKEELETLSKDTEFAKAICLSPRPGEYTNEGNAIPDRADLSVVLSGHDLNNSIHRPERCMPAQGHNILSSSDIPLKLDNGRSLIVRRLRSIQTVTDPKDRNQALQFDSITYYFFVGHNQIEHDHLQRTLTDMKDRLVHGMDQRWAYVSTTMWFGKIPWIDEVVSESEADSKLLSMLRAFAEKQIAWDQVKP